MIETMSYELKNFEILGYTTDVNKCECCGKDNLKGTIAILDTRYDQVLHFGTTCASKANKYDDLEAHKKATKKIRQIESDVLDWRRFAWRMRAKLNIPFEKVDALADDYVKFMLVKSNHYKRYNWDVWK